MNPIRHHSPETNYTLSNLYFKSLKNKDINIIQFNNREIISSQKKININKNLYNNNYDIRDYNYYEEIKKAFNFITFILKQKDTQIKQLRIKIDILQKQLNEINDKNIMTFNKKEIMNSSNDDNLNMLNNINKNYSKRSTFDYNENKSKMLSNENDSNNYKQSSNNFWSTQTQNNSKKILYNNKMNKNNNMLENNINVIHKIKNSTNINKINNYRNNTELINKQNNTDYNYSNNNSNNKYANSEIINNQLNMNMNINEHSKEKKNINQIRKEPYHMNLNHNINIKYINSSGKKYNNYITEPGCGLSKEKMKILPLDNTMSNLGKDNSRSNSFTLSDDGNFIQSKIDVKNYLKEIKSKLEPEKFKKFITLIKSLIKNKNKTMKNQIIYEIKSLLVDKNLIIKFENIMKIK